MIKNALQKPIDFVKTLATKKVIQQFAQRFEFVYFGYVDAREDEHELVRGLTLAAGHRDMHYTVGSFRSHDIALIERHVQVTFPGKQPKKYQWLIMQVDLKYSGYPRIFLDGHRHEEVFYANFFTKYGDFQNASALFTRHDAQFLKYFKVFAARADFDEVWTMLSTDITAMLTHHFRQFDYEIDDDRLFIYASNTVVTVHLLQEMMRVGIWLADQLNSQSMIGPEELK